MTARTILVTGISGIGKTTFINSLGHNGSIQFLSAGSLIKAERERLKDEIHRDMLRFADIGENQKLLIEGFRRTKDHTASLVLLDGHTVIDTQDGLVQIPTEVFSALEIDMFVFLEDEPQLILDRRANDKSRTRPKLAIDILAQHQTEALGITRKIATEMSAPLQVVSASGREQSAAFLQSWLDGTASAWPNRANPDTTSAPTAVIVAKLAFQKRAFVVFSAIVSIVISFRSVVFNRKYCAANTAANVRRPKAQR